MVDEFEKVALDCLSNSFLRKAGLVVIDEVEKPSMLNADPPHLYCYQIGPHLKYTEKFNARLRRIFRDWEGEERQVRKEQALRSDCKSFLKQGHLVVTMPSKSDFEPMPQELLEMSDVEVKKSLQSIDQE